MSGFARMYTHRYVYICTYPYTWWSKSWVERAEPERVDGRVAFAGCRSDDHGGGTLLHLRSTFSSEDVCGNWLWTDHQYRRSTLQCGVISSAKASSINLSNLRITVYTFPNAQSYPVGLQISKNRFFYSRWRQDGAQRCGAQRLALNWCQRSTLQCGISSFLL